MRRRSFVLSSAGLLGLTAGCMEGPGEETEVFPDLPQEVTIEIADASFDPLIVHIAPGGTVTWENTDDEEYSIDAFQFHTGSTSWDFSETVEAGESVSHTFEEEGRFDFTDFARGEYQMCGRVRVGNASEGNSLPCE